MQPVDSKLGKRIGASKMGIIFHTTYEGDSIPNMQASFGADVSALNKSSAVWFDDATYKDLSGKASLSQSENKQILTAMNTAAQALRTADFTAVSGDYKQLSLQYVNARVKRGDTQVADGAEFARDFADWYNSHTKRDCKTTQLDPQAPSEKAPQTKYRHRISLLRITLKV